MEAELFAATAFAPCTVWPRTVMRGKSRKGNSGPESVSKSARRTEPSPCNSPFRCTSSMCQRQKEGKGESRGDRKPYLVSCPLCLCRQTAAIPLVGGNRQSPSASADNLAAEGGNFPESFIKALPEQRPCAPATESAFRSFAAQFLLRVPVRRSTAPPCARW